MIAGQTLGAIVMAVIFEAVPLDSAPEAAVIVAAASAAIASLISLGRARHEIVG